MDMVAEALEEQLAQPCAVLAHPGQQLLLDDRLLYRQARRARGRVGHVGVKKLEPATSGSWIARETSVAPID